MAIVALSRMMTVMSVFAAAAARAVREADGRRSGSRTSSE